MTQIAIPDSLLEKHIANCGGSQTGATILLYRTLAGHSAKDLAAKAGMSSSTLRRLEQGQTVTPESVAAVEVGLELERGTLLRTYFREQKLRIDQLPEDIFGLVVEKLAEHALNEAAGLDGKDPEGNPYTDTAVEEVTRALEEADIGVTEAWSAITDHERIYARVQARIDAADPMDKHEIVALISGSAPADE